MALYGFRTTDGDEIELSFPMGECPSEVRLPDGRVARRIFSSPSISFKGGYMPPRASAVRRNDMTRRNQQAHDRGSDYWRSQSPKLAGVKSE